MSAITTRSAITRRWERGSDPAASPVLRVEALTKHFRVHTIDGRRVDALRGVDLTVAAGEHVALAGTSGAGKSSLLKCIYRSYLPSSGRVWFHRSDGTEVDIAALRDPEVAALRGAELGYVSQFLRAEPRRATLEVVARAGMRRGMAPEVAREAAAVALRRLGIAEELWAMHPTVLSGGEKQRVNLAAGTIEPPRLLLLDEPVSALDPANREAVLTMIDELTDAGVAVLGVFHDLDAMLRLATRVVVLANGRVVDEGRPDDVLTNRLVEVSR